MTLETLLNIAHDSNDRELDFFNFFEAIPSRIELDGINYYPEDEKIFAQYFDYDSNKIFDVEVDLSYKRIFVSVSQMAKKTLQQEKDGYSLRHPSPSCRPIMYTQRQVTFDEMKEWLFFM